MVYIGTSGYYYQNWAGEFYPPSIMKYHYFDYYASHFNSLELNSTFYRFPKIQTMRSWKYKLKNYPEFKLSVKVSRNITHKNRLKDTDLMKDFINNVSALDDKLGVILLQLPPSLKYDILLLEEFVRCLDDKFKYAVEFRNGSWYRLETYTLLRNRNIALVWHDYRQEIIYEQTADFIYVRLHGSNGKYKGSYSDVFLNSLKEKINNTPSYIYFNNTDDNSAFKDALKLQGLLK